MRLNDLLSVETIATTHPSTITPLSPPPPDADAVERILNMVAVPKPMGNDTSPTGGRPLFVRLPQGDVPMVGGVQLRALVDRLGLGILPEPYVNASVRNGDTKETIRAVEAFKRVLGDKNDFYIVAPMDAIDPAEMLKHQTDLPVYIAPSERPTYRSMFTLMPMMRAMNSRIGRLEDRMAAAEEGVKELRRELGRVRQEQESAKERDRQAAARWALARDPMIVAVPKGADPATAAMFLAGPAWGPEFGIDELNALGISPPAKSVASDLSPLLAKIAG
jgi:hypothetical protein